MALTQVSSTMIDRGLATIASASTTDLATTTSENVSVTGTTTITALGTVPAGALRYLTFAGALTFTHNATSLILPGGTNITTAAGDVAAMISLGSGNWRCFNYMKANGQAVVAPASGVTSFIGQTGAVDPSVQGAIGSVCQVFNVSTSILSPNSTTAGSNLAIATGGVGTGSTTSYFYVTGTPANNGGVAISGMGWHFDRLSKWVTGNGGYSSPVGSTNVSACSGTWRILSPALARASSFDACANLTQSDSYGLLAVRIS